MRRDHHCDKWDRLINNPEYRLKWIGHDGRVTNVEQCTDNMLADISLDFIYCPYCGWDFETTDYLEE